MAQVNNNKRISDYRKNSPSFRWNYKKQPQIREKKKVAKFGVKENKIKENYDEMTLNELKEVFSDMHLKDILKKLHELKEGYNVQSI